MYIYIYINFHILFHYGSLQDIEQSSLCYTVGPCWLSIRNIAIYMYHTALLYSVVGQIFRPYSSYVSETLYPLNSNSPYSPPPAPGNHHSTFCLYVFDYFIYLIEVESCSICPSVTDLFHFNMMSPRFIHVVMYGRISFVL